MGFLESWEILIFRGTLSLQVSQNSPSFLSLLLIPPWFYCLHSELKGMLHFSGFSHASAWSPDSLETKTCVRITGLQGLKGECPRLRAEHELARLCLRRAKRKLAFFPREPTMHAVLIRPLSGTDPFPVLCLLVHITGCSLGLRVLHLCTHWTSGLCEPLPSMLPPVSLGSLSIMTTVP